MTSQLNGLTDTDTPGVQRYNNEVEETVVIITMHMAQT